MDLQSGLPLLPQQFHALLAPPVPPWEDKFYIYKPCFDFVWSGYASARVRSIAGRPIPSTKTNSTPVVKQGQSEDPTFKFHIPLQIAAKREMARSLIGVPKFSWIVALKEFAHPPEEIPSVFQTVGATFSCNFHVWFCVSNKSFDHRMRTKASTGTDNDGSL